MRDFRSFELILLSQCAISPSTPGEGERDGTYRSNMPSDKAASASHGRLFFSYRNTTQTTKHARKISFIWYIHVHTRNTNVRRSQKPLFLLGFRIQREPSNANQAKSKRGDERTATSRLTPLQKRGVSALGTSQSAIETSQSANETSQSAFTTNRSYFAASQLFQRANLLPQRTNQLAALFRGGGGTSNQSAKLGST